MIFDSQYYLMFDSQRLNVELSSRLTNMQTHDSLSTMINLHLSSVLCAFDRSNQHYALMITCSLIVNSS